jgi:hypothetical protein
MRSAVSRILVTVVALGAVAGLSGYAAAAQAQPHVTTAPARGQVVQISPARPKPPKLVLSDKGAGKLHLGQSTKAAKATGLIGKVDPVNNDSDPTGCQVYFGKRGVERIYFHKGKVVIVAVKASIKTDRGIGVGSTYKTLHKKYPKASTEDFGRVWVPAPGAKIKAQYRFGMEGSDDRNLPGDTVSEIALQSNSQPCYE